MNTVSVLGKCIFQLVAKNVVYLMEQVYSFVVFAMAIPSVLNGPCDWFDDICEPLWSHDMEMLFALLDLCDRSMSRTNGQ